MEKGDIVKITDGSYAVRVDAYEQCTSIGLNKNDFEILEKRWHSFIQSQEGQARHDIFIKDMVTGKIYLHSSPLVKVVRPPEKMITVGGKEYSESTIKRALQEYCK